MIRKKAGDVEWLEFEVFADEPQLVHGVFLRQGMNLSEALNVQRVAFCHQVHSDAVTIVEEPERVQDCDGLVTHQTDLGLMISHADCQAAIFYDPIHRVLANVHSGWRGNVKNIYRATIQKMAEVYGSKPEDVLVGISPSLGPDNAEFKNYREEFPQTFWEFQVKPEYFDLWAIARYQLEDCGLLPHHIQIAEICTFANPEDYFSYRRDKTPKRHATVAMIKSS